MARHHEDTRSGLLTLSSFALHVSQGGLAELLGVSRRTVSRWVAQESSPSDSVLADLAVRVHPNDADLARRIATMAGTTLEKLGLVAEPPPTANSAEKESRPPPVSIALVVDSVVCAAADVKGEPPAALRPALLAAFERAVLLGLRIEDVVSALRPAVAGAASTAIAEPSVT